MNSPVEFVCAKCGTYYPKTHELCEDVCECVINSLLERMLEKRKQFISRKKRPFE